LDGDELRGAMQVWNSANGADQARATVLQSKHLFLPMRTGRGPIGVVGIESDKASAFLTEEQKRLFDSLADQAALAIERLNLSEDIEKARLTAETERLRSALLTSISHDLKTPLASILGSASTLKSQRNALDSTSQEELIGTIHEEAERLNR